MTKGVVGMTQANLGQKKLTHVEHYLTILIILNKYIMQICHMSHYFWASIEALVPFTSENYC